MPSGNTAHSHAAFAMKPSLPDFGAMSGVGAFAAAFSQTTPTTPEDASSCFFDGISEDSDFLRSSSGSESSASQYAERPTTSSGGTVKVARPPNAWILYRSTKLAEWKSKNPELYTKGHRTEADRGNRPTQASMSKHIADLWKEEPQEVKEHFHKEAMMRSVQHAIENPGYRFNPNKGRKKNTTAKKAKSSKSSSTSPSFSPYTPPLHYQPNFFDGTESPSPCLSSGPYSSVLQLSQELAEATASLPSYANNTNVDRPSTAHSSTSTSSPYRRPSIQAQWAQIFGSDLSDYNQYYGSSSSSSSVSSPPWTGNLLPSLTIDDVDRKTSNSMAASGCTAPATPNSEASAALSLGYPEYAVSDSGLDSTFAFDFSEPVPSMPTTDLSVSRTSSSLPTTLSPFAAATHQPVQVQQHTLAPSATALQPAQSNAQASPDWWPFRNYRVRLDDANGIPLQDLIRALSQN